MEKKANHRERSKTRGKMITQIGSTNGLNSLSSYDSPITYRTKEDRADAELRQLLGSDISDTESMRTGTWGRSRKSSNFSFQILRFYLREISCHLLAFNCSGLGTQYINS